MILVPDVGERERDRKREREFCHLKHVPMERLRLSRASGKQSDDFELFCKRKSRRRPWKRNRPLEQIKEVQHVSLVSIINDKVAKKTGCPGKFGHWRGKS